MYIRIYAHKFRLPSTARDPVDLVTSEKPKIAIPLRQNGNEGPRGTAQLAHLSGAGAAVLEPKKSRGTARDRFL